MKQQRHRMLPEETHDEAARSAFISQLRKYATTSVYPQLKPHYASLRIEHIRKTGTDPKTTEFVRKILEGSNFYNGFSLMVRATQEMLWDTLGEVVERQLPELVAKAAHARSVRGSLTLNPTLPIPDYAAAVDIHVMPGGFHTDLGPDDVFAGALYDRGVYLFATEGLGPLNDELGQSTVNSLQHQFPHFRPQHILDLGCGVGHATLPLVAAYPDAEVHALDLAAPMLRYAAARSAALGMSVHFSQQDARQTDFPDASFDLVTSTLLLHEMPRKAILALLRECNRLLRPGGVMVHHDLLRWPDDPFDSFMMGWTTRHNNEPYERASGTLDFVKENEAVGFLSKDVFIIAQPGVYLEEVYQVSGVRGAMKR
jgi:ubiquinone/menaquinone biosynthesis C-methylase UbiE